MLEVEIEPQEKCNVSESIYDFSRHGLGFNHNVGKSPALLHCCTVGLIAHEALFSAGSTAGGSSLCAISACQKGYAPGVSHLGTLTALLGRPSYHVTHTFLGVDGKDFGNLLHKSPGQAVFKSPFQGGAADLALSRRQTDLPEGSLPSTVGADIPSKQRLRPGE